MRIISRIFAVLLLLALAQEAPAQEKIISPAEITKLAEAETAKTFDADYKAKVQREAEERYPSVKEGDKITIPLQVGLSGAIVKQGVLKAIDRDGIIVNLSEARDRKITKKEIPPELYAAVYGENTELRMNYIQKNYTLARQTFKKSASDRLFQENGYVFDSEVLRWTPKFKVEEQAAGKPDASAPSAEEPKGQLFTVTGEVFYNVSVQNLNPDSIEILHSKGASTIKLEKLTEQSRKRYAPSAAAPKASAPDAAGK